MKKVVENPARRQFHSLSKSRNFEKCRKKSDRYRLNFLGYLLLKRPHNAGGIAYQKPGLTLSIPIKIADLIYKL
jgi:hypothetical protein